MSILVNKLLRFFQPAHHSNELWKAFCNYSDNYYGDQICTVERHEQR